MQAYFLTRQQFIRRTSLLLGSSGGCLGFFFYRDYMIEKKHSEISQHYLELKSNPNHYHTLHEQVALSLSEQEQLAKEREAGITALRRQLVATHAKGIVLETAVGNAMNIEYYDQKAIRKLIGLDWVSHSIQKARQKAFNRSSMQVMSCDIHKTPFSANSIDTIVDTFGLECCYDIDQAYSEMKRITKPGGKILLLERGDGVWQSDRFEIIKKAEINLFARGQFYHYDFSKLIENDPEVSILEKKRLQRGMLYYYVLKKN